MARDSLVRAATLVLSNRFDRALYDPILSPIRMQHLLQHPAHKIHEFLLAEVEAQSGGEFTLRKISKKALNNPSRARKALFFATCPPINPGKEIQASPFNHAELGMKTFALTPQALVRQTFKV